ncbi:MAG: hypothetical protein RJB49_927 [Bacteroidota bacterium]|jgi:hypothetical protein
MMVKNGASAPFLCFRKYGTKTFHIRVACGDTNFILYALCFII